MIDIFEFWFHKRNSIRLITREFEAGEGLSERKPTYLAGDELSWIWSRLKKQFHSALNCTKREYLRMTSQSSEKTSSTR
jgi:hypothetical protein